MKKLLLPPKVEIAINDSVYSFSFYQATWTDQNKARYVAICNTAGCNDVYGEGLGYHRAAFDCFTKLVESGKIK